MGIWGQISLMQSGMRRSERGDPSAGCVPGDGETLGRDAVRIMDVGSACSSWGQEWGSSPGTTHGVQPPEPCSIAWSLLSPRVAP